jgi:two-component system, OmpR family, phosphate regulon response regulator PhoB
MDANLQMRTASDEPRILVIQANRNYLGVMARRLKEFGYCVATAETAQNGIAEMYRVPVDLVLCDVNLPGTTGIEFTRMVREDPVNRELPLLLVVGRSDPTAAVRAFEAGADGVIRKPCHFEVLGACIARQLDRADNVKRLINDNAMLDARVVERAIQIGELRDELAQVRATAAR